MSVVAVDVSCEGAATADGASPPPPQAKIKKLKQTTTNRLHIECTAEIRFAMDLPMKSRISAMLLDAYGQG